VRNKARSPRKRRSRRRVGPTNSKTFSMMSSTWMICST